MSTLQIDWRGDIYDFNAIISENIRAMAARRRMTQSDIAHALGVTQGAISAKYACNRPWSMEDVAVVAAYLGTTPWSLATPVDEKSAQPKLSAVSDLYTARDSNPEPID